MLIVLAAAKKRVDAMKRNGPGDVNGGLEHFSHTVTRWSGSSWAFLSAIRLTLLWMASGPVFWFSDTWQLVMNTVSSIVTFLMVFLIQRSQNHDSLAIQIKLNELIAAADGASNRLIDIEDLTEAEVNRLHQRYQELADRLRWERKSTDAISIEESAAPP
jgi:low affinity Fe/Cu permease